MSLFIAQKRTLRDVRVMSAFARCSQLVDATLYLERQDGVSDDGSTISSRVYGDREDGVMGSLAARGIAESDWAGVWKAVIVDLFSSSAARWDSSCTASSLAVGLDVLGARGDFQGHSGASVGAIDGPVARPLALDGEPRNHSQWRLSSIPSGGS